MAKPKEFETVYEGTIEFEEAANAMAEQCFLYSYQGIFYSMPTQHNLTPPFYCVTWGHYIRVFLACLWCNVKIELWTLGNHVATFFAVWSLVLGEQKVHCAIRHRLAASSICISHQQHPSECYSQPVPLTPESSDLRISRLPEPVRIYPDYFPALWIQTSGPISVPV
ncbi:hypothetical protein EDD22DRAFT_844425 [Suillus occidentalis]|nr:hypothetical protein EDD22DRAFT_844425 [Suillus occidentalis]